VAERQRLAKLRDLGSVRFAGVPNAMSDDAATSSLAGIRVLPLLEKLIYCSEASTGDRRQPPFDAATGGLVWADLFQPKGVAASRSCSDD
jgi:hypothetical protein